MLDTLITIGRRDESLNTRLAFVVDLLDTIFDGRVTDKTVLGKYEFRFAFFTRLITCFANWILMNFAIQYILVASLFVNGKTQTSHTIDTNIISLGDAVNIIGVACGFIN